MAWPLEKPPVHILSLGLFPDYSRKGFPIRYNSISESYDDRPKNTAVEYYKISLNHGY